MANKNIKKIGDINQEIKLGIREQLEKVVDPKDFNDAINILLGASLYRLAKIIEKDESRYEENGQEHLIFESKIKAVQTLLRMKKSLLDEAKFELEKKKNKDELEIPREFLLGNGKEEGNA